MSRKKKTRKRGRGQERRRIPSLVDPPFALQDEREQQPRFAELVESALTEHEPSPKTDDLPSAAARRRAVATLDLHGRRAAEAGAVVKSFLLTHRRLRSPAVRIVTGKGRHSPERPVLKEVVETILRLERRERRIASFQWEGGDRETAGCVLVVLAVGGHRAAAARDQYGQNW